MSDTPDSGEHESGEADPNRGFDMEQIARLGSIMEQHDLSEIRLRRTTDEAEENWTLRRGAQVVAGAAPVAAIPAAAPAPAAAPSAAPAASGPAESAAPQPSGKTIDSPTIGTFYSKPSQDDPPFVSVGDTVTPDTIVCLVEAMKVFNQIPSGVSGTVKAVLVQDGDAVDVGKPLFELG